MTLTTIEELKRLASSDNANELTRRLARECLANREAQPVGFRYRHKDTVSWLYNDWRWPDSVEAEQCQIEWLYTAPPAPAVPVVPEGWEPCSSEWIERNGPCSCGDAPRIAFGTTGNRYHPHMYYNPQPAPAVPEAIITAPIEAMRCGPAASYVLGWNACRAAMLAAAPEGGNG